MDQWEFRAYAELDALVLREVRQKQNWFFSNYIYLEPWWRRVGNFYLYSYDLATILELAGQLGSPLVGVVDDVLVGFLAATLGDVSFSKLSDASSDA